MWLGTLKAHKVLLIFKAVSTMTPLFSGVAVDVLKNSICQSLLERSQMCVRYMIAVVFSITLPFPVIIVRLSS